MSNELKLDTKTEANIIQSFNQAQLVRQIKLLRQDFLEFTEKYLKRLDEFEQTARRIKKWKSF